MPTLFFDIETRSCVDLELAGAWAYAADASTEVLCVGYAVDDADPLIWTPSAPIPEAFITAATNSSWNVVAHNFQFERAIATHILTPRYGWPEIPLERQICSMSLALASALPGKLNNAAAALGLPWQKDHEGYKLMRKMSRPLPRRKSDPPDLVRWHDSPEARAQLAEYCKQDVVLERAVFCALPPLSPSEQALFGLDTSINQRGFYVDIELAKAAREIAQNERKAINAEIAALTENEITTAEQVARILAFVRRHGRVISNLSKPSVSALLAHEPGGTVRRLLELRREGARASVRKLDSLLKSVNADGRLRGTLRFHAASTGRWSGRGYQPQNLKKVETVDIDAAVDAILAGDMDKVRELGAPLTVAADVSRSIICAAPGHKLIGADFSAIESRVLAWLAGEEWKLETYRKYDKTGDPTLEPYCVGASKVLNRPVTPEDTTGRALGKVCDLAFGYGGGLGAWRKFDNTDTYTDANVENFKRDFRLAHRATVEFWHALRRAAVQAVHTGERIEIGKLSFTMENGTLRMWLPSGRAISYPQARLGPGKFEGTREIYFKDNAKGAWAESATWYGLLVENVVQAVSRDLLAAAIMRLKAADYPVVLHIHDEVVCEVPEGFGSTEDFLRLLTVLPDWAEGLPIAAKAWAGKRYAKTKTAPATVAPATMNGVNGVKLHTAAVQTTIEIPPADDEDDDTDDDATHMVPLADLISEPLVDGKIVCPFHDDHTPSLVIYPDHYHCFVCGAHGDAIDWMMMVEGLDRAQAIQSLATWEGPRIEQIQDDSEERRAYALRLWEQAVPIAGTVAARYLSDIRGVELAALPPDIDGVLRLHPRCPFGPGVRHPCLIALMRDTTTNEPTGIHRIALTPEARKIERRSLGCSGAVKLWPAGPQLVVGEGIETVLAAATRILYRDAALQPAWAVLSAGALERFPALPGAERLIILVDHDPAGKNAARNCANRWQRANRNVVRLTPKQTGADFNDLVLSGTVS
jgi:Toprim domain/CHC2 zinc finger/DNA polymerase family A